MRNFANISRPLAQTTRYRCSYISALRHGTPLRKPPNGRKTLHLTRSNGAKSSRDGSRSTTTAFASSQTCSRLRASATSSSSRTSGSSGTPTRFGKRATSTGAITAVTSMNNVVWFPNQSVPWHDATDRIVERLSDPSRAEAYQAKGLVVGHVQSGKTANFTGVLAKAIDAGYRLIIVLTGTTDLLRAQTQRRLDMELVGVENILRGIDPTDHEALDSVDYQDDPDWLNGRFVRHGLRPSDIGRSDIHRLTTHRFDYRSLKQGIAALDFERRDPHAVVL